MKVYIVIDSTFSYEDSVAAVFSSRELADAYIEARKQSPSPLGLDSYVDDYEVDAGA